jgi:uncharacterized protein YgiM (DUF1202 family)
MEEFVVIEEYGNYFVVNIRQASGFIPKSVSYFVQSDIDRYYNVVPTAGIVVGSNSLNVRVGPGTGYASIGKLQAGNQVQIVDQNGEWYVILYTYKNRPIVAYVMTRYIQ